MNEGKTVSTRTRETVYIAGPYAGSTGEEIERNVRRAAALGRLATAHGLAPIVPHTMGWMGVHGSADESVPGVREAALECGVSLARMVGSLNRPGAPLQGQLWIITRDDGSLSSGTKLEKDAFVDVQLPRWAAEAGAGWQAWAITEATWDGWRECLVDAGISDVGEQPHEIDAAVSASTAPRAPHPREDSC